LPEGRRYSKTDQHHVRLGASIYGRCVVDIVRRIVRIVAGSRRGRQHRAGIVVAGPKRCPSRFWGAGPAAADRLRWPGVGVWYADIGRRVGVAKHGGPLSPDGSVLRQWSSTPLTRRGLIVTENVVSSQPPPYSGSGLVRSVAARLRRAGRTAALRARRSKHLLPVRGRQSRRHPVSTGRL